VHPLLKDPWVAAQIDAALEKHRHALTARQLDAFREKMAWTFANHPAAQRILEKARPPIPDQSGERVKQGASEAAIPDSERGGEKAG
jgi:hypothetical protein